MSDDDHHIVIVDSMFSIHYMGATNAGLVCGALEQCEVLLAMW